MKKKRDRWTDGWRENVSCKIVKVTSLPAKRTTTFFALWPGEIRRTSAASIRSRCA